MQQRTWAGIPRFRVSLTPYSPSHMPLRYDVMCMCLVLMLSFLVSSKVGIQLWHDGSYIIRYREQGLEVSALLTLCLNRMAARYLLHRELCLWYDGHHGGMQLCRRGRQAGRVQACGGLSHAEGDGWRNLLQGIQLWGAVDCAGHLPLR